MSEQTVTLPTADGPMETFVATPNRAGRAPALLVAQEAFGVNGHIKTVCRRIAEHGYVALAPELFHRDGAGVELSYDDFPKVMPYLSRMTNAGLLMDVEAGLKELRSRDDVDAARVGIIGFCMGGFTALLTAASPLDVKTAVAFYGGGVVRERPGIGLMPFVGELPRVKVPVLAMFGGEDQSITEGDIEAIRKGLEASGAKHDVVVYPDGGHGFACDVRGSYHEASSTAAWKKTWEWLGEYL